MSVTVQAQLRGALTISSVISHSLPESQKAFFSSSRPNQ